MRERRVGMDYRGLITQLASIHRRSHRAAVTAVNQALTWRNWLIGAWIFSYEQDGSDRAAYGERLLERLAGDLNQRGIDGCTGRFLRQCRQIALAYPELAATTAPPAIQALGIVAAPAAIRLTASAELGIRAKAIRLTPSAELQVDDPQLDTGFPRLLDRIPTSDLPWRDAGFIARMVAGLTWSHLVELARLDQPLKRAFYEVQTLKEGWGVRELRRQLDSLLFERVGLSKRQDQVLAWARSGAVPDTPQAIIRDPYILEFTGLPASGAWAEADLEQALLDHLHDFLLELGKGFCFVGRQYRITIAGKHHHLDLLFYHRPLRCLVAIDLKLGAFDHADAGQMNLYLNWLRENETRPDEHPPVGLILCAGKDDEEVHYATTGLDQQLFVSRYLVELPSEERLRAWLHQEQEVLARIAARSRNDRE